MASTPAIHVVTGKGGVGKTVVAAALSLALAKTGQRVLLCELNGHDRMADLMGFEPAGYKLRTVFEDVTVVDINPHDAMREYVLMTLHFDALYRAVFDNRMVRSFVNLVPSLGELVMLGKIWFHAQETVRDRGRFDALIVDAPATGHALALLAAPQAVREAVPMGPMFDNASLLEAMLKNATQTRVHVVTTPEEMPVTEALRLQEEVRALGIELGALVINQTLTPLPADGLQALAPLAQDNGARGLLEALAHRETHRRAGEVELERLPPTGWRQTIRLPRLVLPTFGLSAVEQLRDCFLPACTAGLL